MHMFATYFQEKKPSILKMSLGTVGFGQQSGRWQSATEQMTEKDLSQWSTLFFCIISIIYDICYVILMCIHHQY